MYVIDGLFLNQKTYRDIPISYRLKYKHSKKFENSCLATRIVSLDTARLHLLTFRILESHPSKDIDFDLSHVSWH